MAWLCIFLFLIRPLLDLRWGIKYDDPCDTGDEGLTPFTDAMRCNALHCLLCPFSIASRARLFARRDMLVGALLSILHCIL